MPMTTTHEEGGCFCGAIRYEFNDVPTGSMMCHCSTCRKIFAAPVVAWLSVPANTFRFIEGTPAMFSSSSPVTRWFCNGCGTHVAYVHADEPGSVDVATCSLDHPSAFPPTHHSWLSHDLAWTRFGDGLPTFQCSRYGSTA